MALIDVKDVTKVYRLGQVTNEVLKGITLSVDEGEFVVIMGPSGSGKSTFMNILGCLDKPTKGTYKLDGIDVANLDRNGLAKIRNKKIGFVFQNFNLLPRMSVFENVELPLIYGRIPKKERRERVMEVLKAVSMEDKAHYSPNQLSGGQQQRVAIARALVNNPSIILADEPTGNLDTKSSLDIMEVLINLNSISKITIILVTHEPDIASYGKRIVKFLDGMIISDEKKRVCHVF